jgi:HSP20 family protein
LWLIIVLAALFFMQTGIILHQAFHKDSPRNLPVSSGPHVVQMPAASAVGPAMNPFMQARRMHHQPYQAQGQQQTAAAQAQQAPDMWQDPFMDDAFFSLGRLTQHMNRLFENMGSFGGMEYAFNPAIDMEETSAAYIIRSDIPGLDKDKIDVSVHGSTLTIQGVRETGSEKKDERTGYYSQERSYGSFARSLMLPGPVDDSKITADYKNGVLTITLPKLNPDKGTNKIPIQ